jgi:protein SCO1/2
MKVMIARRAAAAIGLLALSLTGSRVASAADEHEHHKDASQAATSKPEWTKTQADYRIPELKLIRSDGKKVMFPKELDDGRVVILNFIFTSCTAICPAMSQIFAGLQQRLAADKAQIHMVSVSIDPEEDTPQRLKEYAQHYNAGKQWQFYTGTVEASVALQRAFESYRGDKMNHSPLTFMRVAPGKPWVRIDGFASPDDLAKEYRLLTAQK